MLHAGMFSKLLNRGASVTLEKLLKYSYSLSSLLFYATYMTAVQTRLCLVSISFLCACGVSLHFDCVMYAHDIKIVVTLWYLL